MEEIRAHCGVLSVGSEPERSRSYVWLRECGPFTGVVRTFQRQGLTFMQTAALLEPMAAGPLTELALELLYAAIAALSHKRGSRRREQTMLAMTEGEPNSTQADAVLRQCERLLDAGWLDWVTENNRDSMSDHGLSEAGSRQVDRRVKQRLGLSGE